MKRATLIFLGGVGLLLLVFTAYLTLVEEQGTRDDEAFIEQLNAALADLQAGYTGPVSRAFRESTTVCSQIPPGAPSPDCEKLVTTIADSGPALHVGIVRLRALLEDAPPRASADLLDSARAVLRVAQGTKESNVLLIEGWREQDQTKWDAGWKMREALNGDNLESIE